jgi:hypothetical protein
MRARRQDRLGPVCDPDADAGADAAPEPDTTAEPVADVDGTIRGDHGRGSSQ